MSEFADAVVLITGAAHGIGAACARRFASDGASVIVVDIDGEAAALVADEIIAAGGRAVAHVCDVRDDDAARAMVAAVEADHGAVHVLVNNVGHYLRATPFHRSRPEHWGALHDINLRHLLTVTHAALPAMIERRAGAIVNVSSVEGIRGYPPDPVYGAYKAAVNHFTRCLALELAEFGIRVNAIAPDVTQSQQVDYEAIVPEEDRDLWPVWVPIGRVGQPDDNADVVHFLASDAARFVTGHVVPTDGGTLAAGGWFRTAPGGRWTNRPRRP